MRMTFRVTRFALRAEVDGPVEKRRHESHRDGISDRSRRTAGLFESHRDGISDGPLHSIHTVSIKTFKRNDRNRFQSKLPSRWDSQGVFNHDHLSKLPSRWDSYCMQCNYSDAGFPPVNPAKVGIHSILYHPYTHSRAYLCPPVLDPNTLTGTTHLNHKTHTHSGASECATTRNHHA